MSDRVARNAELKLMLRDRRRELNDDVHNRIRDGRVDRPHEVRDDLEDSDAGIQGDIELALIQMRADTLARIDEALVRLEAGKYGSCFECEAEISERRLRALPFAVRCQACEEKREQEQRATRRLAQRRGLSRYSDEAVSS